MQSKGVKKTSQKHRAKLVSKSAYARHAGVNPSTITRQVQAGIIPTKRGKVDMEAADHARRNALDPAKGGRGGGAPHGDADQASPGATATAGGPSLAMARTALTATNASKAKLDLDIKRGIYVLKADVEREAYEEGARVREALRNWPAREAAQLAARLKVDERQVLSELDAAVTRLLEEMSGQGRS